jgi:transposase
MNRSDSTSMTSVELSLGSMRIGLFKPVHVKTPASQQRRLLLTSRKLLQRKAYDIESDLRGQLRNFGLKVGAVGAVGFEQRVRDLVLDLPFVAAVVLPLLEARSALRTQLAKLHKILLDEVRSDPVCRRLMTAPGVGPVVALTYRTCVDNPARFRTIAVRRCALRPDAAALPIRRDDARRTTRLEVWRRHDARCTL